MPSGPIDRADNSRQPMYTGSDRISHKGFKKRRRAVMVVVCSKYGPWGSTMPLQGRGECMTEPSFVQGAGDVPLKFETIGHAFQSTAAKFGHRDALIVPGQQVRWSYADLKSRVDAMASGLLALGLTPGDRIGIWAPNCAEWTVTQFASAQAGLILVNINPSYRL